MPPPSTETELTMTDDTFAFARYANVREIAEYLETGDYGIMQQLQQMIYATIAGSGLTNSVAVRDIIAIPFDSAVVFIFQVLRPDAIQQITPLLTRLPLTDGPDGPIEFTMMLRHGAEARSMADQLATMGVQHRDPSVASTVVHYVSPRSPTPPQNWEAEWEGLMDPMEPVAQRPMSLPRTLRFLSTSRSGTRPHRVSLLPERSTRSWTADDSDAETSDVSESRSRTFQSVESGETPPEHSSDAEGSQDDW